MTPTQCDEPKITDRYDARHDTLGLVSGDYKCETEYAEWSDPAVDKAILLEELHEDFAARLELENIKF